MRKGSVTRTHCENCNIELNAFNSVWKSSPSNLNPYRGKFCRECHSIWKKEYRNSNKEKTKEQDRKWNLKKLYRITPEKYDEMFEFQQGGCAICRQLPRNGKNFTVDHNHKTGEIRGLLCHDCNIMVGNSREDEDIILNMLEYLKRTTWKEEVA